MRELLHNYGNKLHNSHIAWGDVVVVAVGSGSSSGQ